MNIIWMIYDCRVIPLVYQIGFRNGLQPGDKPTENEFKEVYLRHPDWLKPLGNTQMDIDMIAGNLRENGFKVFNEAEWKRRRK